MVQGRSIYDCGCVISRPKNPMCKTYGTRWKVYLGVGVITLRCRDCGRLHQFSLNRSGVQSICFSIIEEDDKIESTGFVQETKTGTQGLA